MVSAVLLTLESMQQVKRWSDWSLANTNGASGEMMTQYNRPYSWRGRCISLPRKSSLPFSIYSRAIHVKRYGKWPITIHKWFIKREQTKCIPVLEKKSITDGNSSKGRLVTLSTHMLTRGATAMSKLISVIGGNDFISHKIVLESTCQDLSYSKRASRNRKNAQMEFAQRRLAWWSWLVWQDWPALSISRQRDWMKFPYVIQISDKFKLDNLAGRSQCH